MKNKILNFIDNMSYIQFFLIVIPVIAIIAFSIVYVMWTLEFFEDLIKHNIQF